MQHDTRPGTPGRTPKRYRAAAVLASVFSLGAVLAALCSLLPAQTAVHGLLPELPFGPALLLAGLGSCTAWLFARLAREVDARERAEQDLRRVRLAFDNAGDVVVLIDRATMRYIDVNQTLCDLVGYTREELLGMTPMELFGVPRETLERDYDAIIANPGRLEDTLEGHYRHRQGTLIPIETRRRAFLTDRGWIMVCNARDTTERRLAEEALRARERELRLVMDSVPAMIARSDRNQRFVFVNRAYEEMMERTSAQILGRTIRDIVSPENYALAEPYIRRVLAGEAVRFERTQTRSDGRTHHVEVLYVPDTDAEGRVAGWFALHGDVSERVRAEQALAESEARFRAIFEHSLAGIAFSAVGGKFISVNQAYCDLVGYSAGELVDRRSVRDLMDPPDEAFSALFARLVSGEISHFERDRRYRRRDGSMIWGRAAVVTIRDPAGNPKYVLAIVVDVTEAHAGREQIERLNAELEARVASRTEELRAALEELDAFSYSISHDLRSPLRAIGGFATFLRSGEASRLTGQGRVMLARIERNAARMGDMVDGLLRFAQFGRGELQRLPLSMDELARAALSDFPGVAGDTVRLGQLPECNGDPMLLRLVWSNLIGNALKYSRTREAPRVEVDWDAERQAYFVRDNGVGFDMQYGEKLFGVFERLHGESEFEGTGIGLATVRRIIARHGGQVWAEGIPERGATFSFTVPGPGRP